MADNNGGFLGGSPQFNKVGAPAPVDSNDLAAQDTPQPWQPYQIRNAIIVVVVVIMFGVLFYISDPGGVIHKTSGGGHALDQSGEQPSINSLDHK